MKTFICIVVAFFIFTPQGVSAQSVSFNDIRESLKDEIMDDYTDIHAKHCLNYIAMYPAVNSCLDKVSLTYANGIEVKNGDGIDVLRVTWILKKTSPFFGLSCVTLQTVEKTEETCIEKTVITTYKEDYPIPLTFT